MTGHEHYIRAEKLLAEAETLTEADPTTTVERLRLLQLADVHAALAAAYLPGYNVPLSGPGGGDRDD